MTHKYSAEVYAYKTMVNGQGFLMLITGGFLMYKGLLKFIIEPHKSCMSIRV
jgi:hypothetical protein